MNRPIQVILSLLILFGLTAVGSSSTGPTAPAWVKDLGYAPGEVQPITLSSLGIPQIVIKVNEKPIAVLFDTGNAGNLTLTTVVEKEFRYKLVSEEEELEPDGTHRGWSKIIELSRVEIGGEVFQNHRASLVDWNLMGSDPFNGLVGLNYFRNRRVTLDYKNLLLAVSAKPIPDAIRSNSDYAVLPLLKAPVSQGEIIYVVGEVNGHPQTIYLDTGTTPSTVSPEAAAGSKSYKARYHDFFKSDNKFKSIKVKFGKLALNIADIYESRNIKRGTKFEYPVGLVLGSDKLKDLVMTVDKIGERLILRKAD